MVEFVGVFEAADEELVLGVAGSGGGEFKMEGGDGGGNSELLEVGVEAALEEGGVEGGFGESELAGVGCAIIESEMELEGGGGVVVVAKAVAEGVEEAFGHEKEGFMAVHGGLKVVFGLVVLGGAVEGEEAMSLLVGDIVEGGEFWTESLGEPLTGKLGEIAQGVETPEL